MPTVSPVELLQKLIRFNTTNPPGKEREGITYIDSLLNEAGVQTTLLARDPQRPNLIARLAGQSKVPPLLLYGHVDVVTTENQTWQHPPFEGRLANGYVWGRGALDMKGGVAMMLAAFLRAKAPGHNKLCLARDEKMVTKTSHYTQGQLAKLRELATREGVGDAVLLREALDGLFEKYDRRL